MDFDLSTFLLEMLNFLVLVWILKRFFYKPVRKAIDDRQQAIEKSLADAAAARAAAEALKSQYDTRMAAWDDEKRAAQRKLQEDMASEKARQLEALQKSMQDERQRLSVLEERKQQEITRQNEAAALASAAGFAARLLTRVSGPALSASIVDVFLEDIKKLPAAEKTAVQTAVATTATADIVSAYVLMPEKQKAIAAALGDVAGRAVACDFTTNDKMIAGIRVSLGAYVLQASVAGELQFFAQATTGNTGMAA